MKTLPLILATISLTTFAADIPKDDYCSRYMDYLFKAKTARRSYAECVKKLEAAGFKQISSFKSLKPGDRVYRGYQDRTVMAAVIGKQPISEVGLKVVGGHTDAPRLDLKPHPLYEKGGILYFDCVIYGGIKKYQWVTLPLALYGTIVKKDGSKVNVAVGDNEGDVGFMISDLLPHFGWEQGQKKRDEFYPAEDLDVICWSTTGDEGKKKKVTDEKKDDDKKDEEKKPKDLLVEYLKNTYDVEEDDLLSAELEIVPAGKPRYIGLDKGLIGGYGQDDRSCSFAGLTALIDVADDALDVTASIVMCDKEEIGSVGSTGMDSSFFENTVAELIVRQTPEAGDIAVRRSLEKSSMLSADVTGAEDPHFDSVSSTGNAAKFHKGPCMIKYTGGVTKGGASDASPEFIAKMRAILDATDVTWQMAELGRMEKGGGGTISKYMARFGMEVVDFGTGVWNMHAPWELTSAFDCWQTYLAYKAYLK